MLDKRGAESDAEVARANRRYGDTRFDEGYYTEPINFNLQHLTLSEEALGFFHGDERLKNLVPLIDQIVATNKLDGRGALFYKYLVDSLILRLLMFSNEDDPQANVKIHAARNYMYALIDGTINGHRANLATEIRRVYRSEEERPKKRRGILW